MNAVRVIQPGMMTTVQDLGRPGRSDIGVARGGAADALSLRVGNRLVGNGEDAAGLEMTVMGGVFEFERAAVVALTGGVVEPEVRGGGSDRKVAWARAFEVRAGERLHVGRVVRGARTYLCVAGGVSGGRVPACMGSLSTSVAGGFGGFEGRALRTGDVVEFGESGGRVSGVDAGPILESALFGGTLRACALDEARTGGVMARGFWGREYSVASQSDRMGVRLEGPKCAEEIGGDGKMVSEGMMHGAVQVPPGGAPIVLGVEHPTTGGYRVIACVAAVDLPALGQCGPGRRVKFEKVSHAAARDALRAFEARLEREVVRI